MFYREFFYIQMEKYARQALSEGVKSDTELHVTEESELYRVINVHYNRNNHIEVSFWETFNLLNMTSFTLSLYFPSTTTLILEGCFHLVNLIRP